MQGKQQVVTAIFQQGLVAEGSGSDDANHLALYRALACLGVANLFANRHGHTQTHQFRQVAIGAVIGNARHRNGLAGGFSAGGQGDVEQFSRAPGVVIKQLIEVAHAVEHQFVRMLRFDAQVLLHHRGVLVLPGLLVCSHVFA